jgi:hypothetical protein
MAEVPKQIGELITKNPNDKTRLQREIEATDRRIDQLVYSEALPLAHTGSKSVPLVV